MLTKCDRAPTILSYGAPAAGELPPENPLAEFVQPGGTDMVPHSRPNMHAMSLTAAGSSPADGSMGATAGEVRHGVDGRADAAGSHPRRGRRNAKDDKGRSATFRILLFSDEFRWRINSFDAIEQAGKRPQFTSK